MVEKFKDKLLTKAQRFLLSWERKLEEREGFLDETPYNASNFEMLEKIMGNSDKLWKAYQQCEKDVLEESSQTMGQQLESFLEKED